MINEILYKMLDALTSPYSQKDAQNVKRGSPLETNIGKLFSLLAWGLSIVKGNAEKVKLWDDIDNAEGKVLDRYGVNWGVKRFGATDRYYSLAIKVKVLSQLSGGDIDTVIRAAADLMELEPEQIELIEQWPAKIGILVNEDDLSPETMEIITDIAIMIKRIVAAGVGLITTLKVYRHENGETTIENALFDRTDLEFDLPEVRHKSEEHNRIEGALFDRSELEFDLPKVRRRTDGFAPVKTGIFDYDEVFFDFLLQLFFSFPQN